MNNKLRQRKTHYIFLSLEGFKVVICAHIIMYMLQISVHIYIYDAYIKILNKRDIVSRSFFLILNNM